MQKCIKLAKRGMGFVEPNPYVGCVIVKNNKIIAKGYHKKFGGNHAEIDAIKNAKENTADGTLYVNLEPCAHKGKTPPCVKAIIKAGIKKVYIAAKDPNKLVSGKGIDALKNAGIKVHLGICKKEAEELNEKFFKWITNKQPFVTLKIATNKKNIIAEKNGERIFFTNKKTNEFVHRLRNSHQAIMVGINTIINDNPLLTARIKKKKTHNPLRIILDSKLKISSTANVLKDDNFLIATGKSHNEKNYNILTKKFGKKNIWVSDSKNKVNLKALFSFLGKNNIQSVLIEGGAKVMREVLKKKYADKLIIITTKENTKEGITWKNPNEKISLKKTNDNNIGGAKITMGYSPSLDRITQPRQT